MVTGRWGSRYPAQVTFRISWRSSVTYRNLIRNCKLTNLFLLRLTQYTTMARPRNLRLHIFASMVYNCSYSIRDENPAVMHSPEIPNSSSTAFACLIATDSTVSRVNPGARPRQTQDVLSTATLSACYNSQEASVLTFNQE